MKDRKIYHEVLEVCADVQGQYLLITEVCIKTGKELETYIIDVPDWVNDSQTEEFRYYHPIIN